MAAKKKQENAGSGKVVELADKDGGFYDPATGLKIVRGQQVALGTSVGKKTNTALLSGRLVIVGGSTAPVEETPAEETTDETDAGK